MQLNFITKIHRFLKPVLGKVNISFRMNKGPVIIYVGGRGGGEGVGGEKSWGGPGLYF